MTDTALPVVARRRTNVVCGRAHDHTLSPVEDIGDGRQVMECINGCGEFILEPDGCLVPICEPLEGGW